MRLNAQTDYSLRIMMVLATQSDSPATIREIAIRLGLSRPHMMQIAAKLAAKGLVTASRGRTGGLLLARDPRLISVEDVVTAIEPDFALVQCLQAPSKPGCSIEPACLLKDALMSALEAFFAELRAVSLAELVSTNRTEITEIFRLHMSAASVERARRRTNIAIFERGTA